MRLYLYQNPGGYYHSMIILRVGRFCKYLNRTEKMDHIIEEEDARLNRNDFKLIKLREVR